MVIYWQAFGRNSPFSPYDQGRTATHEIGHYLGLCHTFQGGCATATPPACYSSGDTICDTPSEQQPFQGCSGERIATVQPDKAGHSHSLETVVTSLPDPCAARFLE